MLVHLTVARLAVCASFLWLHLHRVLDLLRITLGGVSLAWSMTTLTTSSLSMMLKMGDGPDDRVQRDVSAYSLKRSIIVKRSVGSARSHLRKVAGSGPL